MVYPPRNYGTVDIDVLWIKDNVANTGDVVFRLGYAATTIGQGPANALYAPNVKAYADVHQGELRRTRLASGLDISKTMATLLMLERLGSDAADTVESSVKILWILVSATPDYPGKVLSPNGGWYCMNEHWLLGNHADNALYCRFINSEGDAGAAKLNIETGVTSETILHWRFQLDDHAVPALLTMPDGNLLAIYARYSIVGDPIYVRRTVTPGDITYWTTAVQIPTEQPWYPKPTYIGNRLYVFFRHTTRHDFISSDDNGATWSTPAPMFSYSTGWRGYVNYKITGTGASTRVDFTTTDDNPSPTGSYSNLYHCYLQNGNFYKSDGTLIGALGAGAITPAQMTKIYDHTSNGDAWLCDIQHDFNGRPVIMFSTFPALENHLFWYTRWTGTAWALHQMTYAGPSPYDLEGEPRYSGGLSILADGTGSTVYLSRWVGCPMEVEKWQTTNGGAAWTSTPVTTNSPEKNFWPTSPEGWWAGCPEVAWMIGWYVRFTRYHTRIIYR